MRRPTLDDVFLTLTGRHAEPGDDGEQSSDLPGDQPAGEQPRDEQEGAA
jgi:ABC-2 type transport system ATP-binding protein